MLIDFSSKNNGKNSSSSDNTAKGSRFEISSSVEFACSPDDCAQPPTFSQMLYVWQHGVLLDYRVWS